MNFKRTRSFSKRIFVSSGSSKGGLTNSRLSLMALLAKVSASSTRVSLIWSPLLLVSQESISPMIAGQKGRHSWLSIEERLTIKRDSCSQTIRQKSQIVLSRGCWVTMNSRRSKKPEKIQQKWDYINFHVKNWLYCVKMISHWFYLKSTRKIWACFCSMT